MREEFSGCSGGSRFQNEEGEHPQSLRHVGERQGLCKGGHRENLSSHRRRDMTSIQFAEWKSTRCILNSRRSSLGGSIFSARRSAGRNSKNGRKNSWRRRRRVALRDEGLTGCGAERKPHFSQTTREMGHPVSRAGGQECPPHILLIDDGLVRVHGLLCRL